MLSALTLCVELSSQLSVLLFSSVNFGSSSRRSSYYFRLRPSGGLFVPLLRLWAESELSPCTVYVVDKVYLVFVPAALFPVSYVVGCVAGPVVYSNSRPVLRCQSQLTFALPLFINLGGLLLAKGHDAGGGDRSSYEAG